LIITLYNVNETDTDFYLSKLREVEKHADFVSNREGDRPKIKIEATDKDIPAGELKEQLTALGFYIFKEYIALDLKTGGYIGTIELTLERNLLIVGNGFDLEHNLKTKYTDFLNKFNRYDIKTPVCINNINYNVENNNFLIYILDRLLQKKMFGDNWIDIETELKLIVEYIEKIYDNFIDEKVYERHLINDILINNSNFTQLFDNIFEDYNADNLIFKKKNYLNKISALEQNLDNFVDMLRNYLLEETSNLNDIIKSPDILNIDYQITHVLSFNYTDTFRQVYSTKLEDEYIDFIHGKLDKNNLVLGTSETLPDNKKSKIIDAIYLKKYFQRIFKKTNYKYTNWLKNTKFKTVYIHGHSLDESDGEILRKIINTVLSTNNEKINPTIKIFYKDKNHYRQEIANLVQVLGKDAFEKYYSSNKIVFIEQHH